MNTQTSPKYWLVIPTSTSSPGIDFELTIAPTEQLAKQTVAKKFTRYNFTDKHNPNYLDPNLFFNATQINKFQYYIIEEIDDCFYNPLWILEVPESLQFCSDPRRYLTYALQQETGFSDIIYPPEYPEGIPLLFYINKRTYPSLYPCEFTDTEHSLDEVYERILIVLHDQGINLNITDQWGRNLLHNAFSHGQEIYAQPDELSLSRVNFPPGNYAVSPSLYNTLVELGVDPDHRAIAQDQNIITLAKIKGTLPPDYGKTPNELLEKNMLRPKYNCKEP